MRPRGRKRKQSVPKTKCLRSNTHVDGRRSFPPFFKFKCRRARNLSVYSDAHGCIEQNLETIYKKMTAAPMDVEHPQGAGSSSRSKINRPLPWVRLV